MAWYLRVVELSDGAWACRHGREQFDTHNRLEDAVTHLRALAAERQPAELVLHWMDGSVEHIAAE